MIQTIFNKIINNKTNFSKNELDILAPYVKNGYIIQDNNSYSLSKKYKVGLLHIQDTFNKLLPLNNDKQTIKIDDTKGCNSGDFILVQLIFNPKGILKAKIIKTLQTNQNDTMAYLKENKLYDIKSLSKIDMKIDIKNYKQDDILLLQQNKIKDLIGNLQDPYIDEKISLYLYNQSYRSGEYSTNIKQINNYSSRVDLTQLDFCTIDPVDAKDHDDAIYYDNQTQELYVAIADVSAYVKENTKLDEDARKRAFSIYLPNKVLPMIPHILSDDLCSLKPNVNRLAYVCKMKIDTKLLEVEYFDIFEAVINSKHKYSYEDIDNKILTNSLDKNLKELYQLTLQFRQKRLKNGYDFQTTQLRLKLNDKLNVTNVAQENSTNSHKLVEECMLLANLSSAKKLDDIGIYRVHDAPKRTKIDDLLKNVSLLGLDVKLKKDIHSTILSLQQKAKNASLQKEVDTLIIQSQQQASYKSTKSGHFGLGFENYSHFTSPIRRYSDLILHRILKTNTIPKDIGSICEYISTQEREITKLVWDLEDRIYARFALKNIDKIFEAIVTQIGEFPKGELVGKISGLNFEIQNYQEQNLFEKIKIKFVKSDIISKKIVAKIVKG